MKRWLTVGAVLCCALFWNLEAHSAQSGVSSEESPLIGQDYLSYFLGLQTIYLEDFGYRTFDPREKSFRLAHDRLGERVREEFFNLSPSSQSQILKRLYILIEYMDRTVWDRRAVAAYPEEYREQLVAAYLDLALPLATTADQFLGRLYEIVGRGHFTPGRISWKTLLSFDRSTPDFSKSLAKHLDFFYGLAPSWEQQQDLMNLTGADWSLEFSDAMLARATSPAEFLSYLPSSARNAQGSYRLQINELLLKHMDSFLELKPTLRDVSRLYRASSAAVFGFRDNAVLTLTQSLLINSRTSQDFLRILQVGAARNKDKGSHFEGLFQDLLGQFISFNPSPSQVNQAMKLVYPKSWQHKITSDDVGLQLREVMLTRAQSASDFVAYLGSPRSYTFEYRAALTALFLKHKEYFLSLAPTERDIGAVERLLASSYDHLSFRIEGQCHDLLASRPKAQ